MEIRDIENFTKLGFLKLKNSFNKNLCQKLNNDISKIRIINKNIFLSEKGYLNQKRRKKKRNIKNILDNFNLDFIFKNKIFLEKIKFILGEDFEIYAKRIICGVPQKLFPMWVSSRIDLQSPNIGSFVKPKYRDIRYFHGIDYHQDLIDFSLEKGNFVTVYIYLSNVTKKMSPLNIIPGTHLCGPGIFPHDLVRKKNKIIYKSDGGKVVNSKSKMLIGEAGDVWIWHSCLLHGTEFNVTSKPRFSLRLILRQKKNCKNALMNKVNKKIKNIIAFKKMIDYSRYETLGAEKKIISKYR